MKKYLFGLLVLLGSVNFSYAAAGDTTWVQANMAQLAGYGNYDTSITFPTGGTYRNIYMIFTLGKYVCPGTPTYCGDWDYTVLSYLLTPGGDSLEIGRLISPYANSGAPRTPPSWTQRYVYDVTDYASKLQGAATMRILYSGYSGGFTANIRFAFVEGTPERNVTGIERLWRGSFGYGGTPSINTHFPDMPKIAPAGTQSADLKFTVTGHGSDDSGCCEFYNKSYQVMLNSSSVATKAIWRDDCGANQLYPQSGTWLYDRANWCPGASVNSNYHNLPGVTAGTPFTVGILFDPFTSTGGGLGSYTTEAHLIYYGGINNVKDGAITDIISPTDNENHFRENPICGSPIIRVKNRGQNTITAMDFEYGVQDSVMQTYSWTGTLAPLGYTDVSLPELVNLQSMAGGTVTSTFVVKLKTTNGTQDADTTNDIMTSTFRPSPKWDGKFRIIFKPNNETAAGGTSETEWKIYDHTNTVVAQRTGATINLVVTDTVTLPTGCYRLEITDGGKDGLHWWVWDSNPGLGVNAGSLFVRKLGSNANVPMNGYVYSSTYAHDFGSKFTQYFYTYTYVNGITDIAPSDLSMSAYPNPASNLVYVDLAGMMHVNGTISIIDVLGRVVKTIPCNTAHNEINTDGMNNGLYTILFANEAGNKLQSKIIIAK